jgi:hypothetical protein
MTAARTAIARTASTEIATVSEISWCRFRETVSAEICELNFLLNL